MRELVARVYLFGRGILKYQFGVINEYWPGKEHGTIRPRDGSSEVSFHNSHVHKSERRFIRIGQLVAYHTEQNRRGTLLAQSLKIRTPDVVQTIKTGETIFG